MENRDKGYRERIRDWFDPCFYERFVGFCDRIGVPNWFFDSVKVEGLESVVEVKNKQLFYVSNHVSMADFLMQTYVFWKHKLPRPRFIAGENLNYFPLKHVWKKCGAISVDRKERDRDYWQVFQEEVKRCLRESKSLLDYPEGGRNYEGKGLKKFKTGIFGFVADIVKNGQEIWGVPIKSSYDRRVEEEVLDSVAKHKEKRDMHRRNGNPLRAKIHDLAYYHLDFFLAYPKRFFEKNKGNCYLEFGEPFPIRDYLETREGRDKVELAKKFREELER